MNTWFKLAVLGGLLLGGGSAFADHRYDNRGHDNHGWRGNDHHAPAVNHWDRGRHDDTRWSVNLNFGSGYRVAPGLGWSWSSYPYGWRTFHSRPSGVVTYSQPRTVIIENNTYVTPDTTVTYGSSVTSGTSLFRDRYGRCYERRLDGLGNEIRTELPASACNF